MGRTVNPLAYAYGGSNPSLPTNLFTVSQTIALVAQLAEHTLGKGEVTDSSSVKGSIPMLENDPTLCAGRFH